MDDLTVSDIDSNVALVPDGKAGDLRDGVDHAFLDGVGVHGICANVRHAVRAVFDLLGISIQPTVALDEADAVGAAPSQPMRADEFLLTADLVGVL